MKNIVAKRAQLIFCLMFTAFFLDSAAASSSVPQAQTGMILCMEKVAGKFRTSEVAQYLPYYCGMLNQIFEETLVVQLAKNEELKSLSFAELCNHDDVGLAALWNDIEQALLVFDLVREPLGRPHTPAELETISFLRYTARYCLTACATMRIVWTSCSTAYPREAATLELFDKNFGALLSWIESYFQWFTEAGDEDLVDACKTGWLKPGVRLQMTDTLHVQFESNMSFVLAFRLLLEVLVNDTALGEKTRNWVRDGIKNYEDLVAIFYRHLREA